MNSLKKCPRCNKIKDLHEFGAGCSWCGSCQDEGQNEDLQFSELMDLERQGFRVVDLWFYTKEILFIKVIFEKDGRYWLWDSTIRNMWELTVERVIGDLED